MSNSRTWQARQIATFQSVHVSATTSRLADDPRVELLREKMVELLQLIELELILGGDYATRQEQLVSLLDWIARQD